MTEIKIGDRLKDNDPRMKARVLVVTGILPNGVATRSPVGRAALILRRRIYTDGKPRRNGFDLMTEEVKELFSPSPTKESEKV